VTIRFGVSPIAWINDDMPELGGDTPLESVLQDARDIGFSGIELGGAFPRDPTALRSLLGRYDLDLVGGWYSANLLVRSAEDEIDALQPHLGLLKAMGSTVFVIAETSNAIHGARQEALSGSPALSDEQWRTFGQRMTRVADYIQEQGLRFAYHHHLGTSVETAQELERFLAVTGPSVGLTVDSGHAALGGIDPASLIRAHPERVAHVHCKDVRRPVYEGVTTRGGSFLDGVLQGMFTVPGDGDLDFDEVLQALADISYSGWIIIEAEQDPAVADPRTYAELGLGILRAKAADAGLKEAA
jgi:inosose dehydratase